MTFLLKLTGMAALLTAFATKNPSIKYIRGEKKYVPNRIFVFLIIAIFTFFAAVRSNVGDTEQYMYSFEVFNSTLKECIGLNNGFYLFFVYPLKNLGFDSQSLIIVTSLIIYPFILWRLLHNSDNAVMSVILFVFSGSFVNSMNGLKQFIVTVVLFLIYPWIVKTKDRKWIIVVLFLSLIHATALILIPIYYVSKWKPWSAKSIFLIIFIAVVFLMFNSLAPTLYEFLEGTRYANYENADYTMQKVNVFRILFSCIPIFLAFICRNIKCIQDPETNFIVNNCLFYFVFMLFGYYGASYARFCIYFELYPLLLIPRLINNCFKTDMDKSIMKLGFYLLYFAFFFYQIQISWGGFSITSKLLGMSF